jgi:hypothetical protein
MILLMLIKTKYLICNTISLRKDMLKATDLQIKQGKAKNEFIAEALGDKLATLERVEIDAAITEMTQDPDYLREVLKMEAEFATLSSEALKLQELF